jgi:hypothetical protein
LQGIQQTAQAQSSALALCSASCQAVPHVPTDPSVAVLEEAREDQGLRDRDRRDGGHLEQRVAHDAPARALDRLAVPRLPVFEVPDLRAARRRCACLQAASQQPQLLLRQRKTSMPACGHTAGTRAGAMPSMPRDHKQQCWQQRRTSLSSFCTFSPSTDTSPMSSSRWSSVILSLLYVWPTSTSSCTSLVARLECFIDLRDSVRQKVWRPAMRFLKASSASFCSSLEKMTFDSGSRACRGTQGLCKRIRQTD